MIVGALMAPHLSWGISRHLVGGANASFRGPPLGVRCPCASPFTAGVLPHDLFLSSLGASGASGAAIALIASTVALGACQGATLPDRLPGLAAFYPDAAAAALIVPDTVRAGVPFAVTIQTLTGECRQSGRTDVVHAGQVAALTLYRDMACSESGTRGSSWGAPCRSASIRRVRPLSA